MLRIGPVVVFTAFVVFCDCGTVGAVQSLYPSESLQVTEVRSPHGDHVAPPDLARFDTQPLRERSGHAFTIAAYVLFRHLGCGFRKTSTKGACVRGDGV